MRIQTATSRRRLTDWTLWGIMPLVAACSGPPLPMQPSSIEVPPVTVMHLEAEAGSGDGQVRERSRASGGLTVHLGPGERRVWRFDVRAERVAYVLSVTYSNGKEGPNELIQVSVDGNMVSSFQDRDSGDSIDGWNQFVTDPAGTSTLGRGSHTFALDVSDGDGCVEIDVVTLRPAGAVASE